MKTRFFFSFLLGLTLLSSFLLTPQRVQAQEIQQESEEDDFLLFEEVTCESLKTDFKNYSDIVILLQSSFSQIFFKISVLTETLKNKEFSEEELEELKKELRTAQSAMAENQLFLQDISWKIEEAIDRCTSL